MAWMRMMGAESVEYHRSTVLERGDDYPGMALVLLRVARRDAASLGRHRGLRFGPGRPRQRRGVRSGLRSRRGPPPRHRAAVGVGPTARYGAGDLGAQERRRVGSDRPGRGHASDHGRRARRHLGLPRSGDLQRRRPARSVGHGDTDGRAGLRPHPPRNLAALGILAHTIMCCWPTWSRSATSSGRLEGRGYRPVAGTSARRHHGRARRGSPGRGRTRIRHRGGSGPVGTASGTGGSPAFPRRSSTCIRSGRPRSMSNVNVVGPTPRGPGRWRRGPPARPRNMRWAVSWWDGGGPSWRRSDGRYQRLTQAIDNSGRELGSPAKLSLKTVRAMLGDVLSSDGDLARRKVFSRRHMIVEMAPLLFGQDPRILDLLADRALQDPEAIPLVGVAGARNSPTRWLRCSLSSRPSPTAVGRQLERSDAPTTSPAAVDKADRGGRADPRCSPVGRAAPGGSWYLPLRTGRGAGGGRGRGRQNHNAQGGGGSL